MAGGIVLAFALGACGSSDGDSGDDSSGADTTESAGDDTATDDTVASGDADGSIVVGSTNGFPQLNPVIRTFAYEETLFPLLWTSLTQASEDGAIVPQLAESWTTNDDATEWTFTLVDGATFSDGSPIDATEVKKALDYYLDPETVTQERNKIDSIESVDAPDAKTVVFNMNRPNALLPESITWVKIIKVDALDDINTSPVTSGPFVVEDFSPDTSLTITRNDSYWGEPAGLATIEFTAAADPTAAVTALRNGDIDILWGTPLSDVGGIEDQSQLQIVRPEVPSQAVTWELDVSSPPFDNELARQAINYAVDRETILQAAYFGQGEVSTTNNILADSNPAHASGLIEYSYDLEKAADLFEQAGMTEGTKLTWWGRAGARPEWDASGQILQASLAEIGIELVIDNNETAVWVDAFYPAGKSFPDYVVPNVQSVPAEPAFSMNFLLSGRCECNWNNAEFDALYEEAIATVDPAERNEIWAQARMLENEQAPLITPLQVAPVAGANADLMGVWMEGGGQIHLENASIAQS
ncbi:MAG: ABC transporter substrate-binding protein [Ilumatobacteraceae bacterium]